MDLLLISIAADNKMTISSVETDKLYCNAATVFILLQVGIAEYVGSSKDITNLPPTTLINVSS